MKKKIVYICLIILLFISVFEFGFIIGIKKTNNTQTKKHNIVTEEQKVVSGSIIISSSSDNSAASVTTNDLKNKLIETYKELINSQTIRNIVQEKYPNANKVELECIDGTNIMKVIYVCGNDNYNDDECIDIVNTYISVFKEKVEEIYKIDNIQYVDGPEIVTRTIIKEGY